MALKRTARSPLLASSIRAKHNLSPLAENDHELKRVLTTPHADYSMPYQHIFQQVYADTADRENKASFPARREPSCRSKPQNRSASTSSPVRQLHRDCRNPAAMQSTISAHATTSTACTREGVRLRHVAPIPGALIGQSGCPISTGLHQTAQGWLLDTSCTAASIRLTRAELACALAVTPHLGRSGKTRTDGRNGGSDIGSATARFAGRGPIAEAT